MKIITYPWLFLAVIISQSGTNAQSFDSLNRYKNAVVFYSDGFESRAAIIENDIRSAIDYYAAALNFKPTISVLILAADDWGKYTSMPVYGMPH